MEGLSTETRSGFCFLQNTAAALLFVPFFQNGDNYFLQYFRIDGRDLQVRCFLAVDVVQDSTGEKLRFVPPLLVEQSNHGLVLRVMYIKTDGKFTRIFFVRHDSHRSPC